MKIAFDPAKAAAIYKKQAEDLEREAAAFERGVVGARLSPETAQLKAGEYGVLVGKAAAYRNVQEQMEHLVKKAETGDLHVVE